jgi:hypothetical protein
MASQFTSQSWPTPREEPREDGPEQAWKAAGIVPPTSFSAFMREGGDVGARGEGSVAGTADDAQRSDPSAGRVAKSSTRACHMGGVTALRLASRAMVRVPMPASRAG